MDDVLVDLHALGVGRVDEVLVGGSGRLEPRVDLVEVVAVVAVVVVVRAVEHDRGDPDRGEAEPLDVVELLHQALEVPPEHGVVVGRVAGLLVLAAAPVVRGVAVVEAGGEHEVDRVLAGVGAQRCARGRGGGLLTGGDGGRRGLGRDVPGGVDGPDGVAVRGPGLKSRVGEDGRGGVGDHGALRPAGPGDLIVRHAHVVRGGFPRDHDRHPVGGGLHRGGCGRRLGVRFLGGARVLRRGRHRTVLHRGEPGRQGVVAAVVVVPDAVAVVERGLKPCR
ncbi:hypothetical protein GA0115253_1052010 [Streptomyces sp. Termitarium-T10T-6]|nr:hypothetical protein GA0115253_1052010 [Streptomyces sp. Termitarium-T10T-6]